MNIDDPKLTAFALDELDEPEKSAIAREVAESLEALRYIEETRVLVRALKGEFANDLRRPTTTDHRFINIQGEPWFWSIARPLALAAAIAVLVILGTIMFGNYKLQQRITLSNLPPESEIEAEEIPQKQIPAANQIPNPLQRDTIQRIEHVVIGELAGDSNSTDAELRFIESINDPYRIERIKERLQTPVIGKKSERGLAGHSYQLILLDRQNQIVAAVSFYSVPQEGFVLQPLQRAYERDNHYFIGGDRVLPGDWKNSVDYRVYAIPFPNWRECIGYSPGA